jgi:hypothetical protein
MKTCSTCEFFDGVQLRCHANQPTIIKNRLRHSYDRTIGQNVEEFDHKSMRPDVEANDLACRHYSVKL